MKEYVKGLANLITSATLSWLLVLQKNPKTLKTFELLFHDENEIPKPDVALDEKSFQSFCLISLFNPWKTFLTQFVEIKYI